MLFWDTLNIAGILKNGNNVLSVANVSISPKLLENQMNLS